LTTEVHPQPSSQPLTRPTLGHSRTPSTSLSRAPSSRSIPPPSPRASSPSKPGLGQSARGSTRLAAPSPTKRSPIPTTHQQTALKRTGLTPRLSMNEGALSVSRSTGGDSPDSAPHVRTSQLKQVSSPVQHSRGRVPSGVAQAATIMPTSTLHPPTSSPPPELRELVSVNTSSPFCANGYEVRSE
jgi:hypothetical protein